MHALDQHAACELNHIPLLYKVQKLTLSKQESSTTRPIGMEIYV